MMKTFKDLKFEPHPIDIDGLRAVMMFENGYGVSVVQFKVDGRFGSYTSNEDEWELAVLKGNEKKWAITYDTPITDDVIGYLSAKKVSKIMKQVQSLRKV